MKARSSTLPAPANSRWPPAARGETRGCAPARAVANEQHGDLAATSVYQERRCRVAQRVSRSAAADDGDCTVDKIVNLRVDRTESVIPACGDNGRSSPPWRGAAANSSPANFDSPSSLSAANYRSPAGGGAVAVAGGVESAAATPAPLTRERTNPAGTILRQSRLYHPRRCVVRASDSTAAPICGYEDRYGLDSAQYPTGLCAYRARLALTDELVVVCGACQSAAASALAISKSIASPDAGGNATCAEGQLSDYAPVVSVLIWAGVLRANRIRHPDVSNRRPADADPDGIASVFLATTRCR